MKNEMKDLKSITQSFLTAYDAHDVEGMLAVCANGALGRYAPTAARVSCRFEAALMPSGAPFRRPSRVFESK